MSLTRNMIHKLRERDRPPAPAIQDAPRRTPAPAPIQPDAKIREPTRFAAAAADHTTAMVGIGATGTRYYTDVVLQFQAELAVAHEAVAKVLPEDWAAQNNLLGLQSRVTDHGEFLLRPDRGRRLDESSLSLLREKALKDVDIQPILADGLSAVACMGSGMDLLKYFGEECEKRGWTLGTPMCARFARVWLQDEIGQEVRAKVAVILLGERPGLGTGDGLSAYMVHEPRIGKTDGDRNMMSNIHSRGTPPPEAGLRLALLAGAMLEQGTSGVGLKLDGLKELGDAGGTGYREPQKREKLVETD